MADRPDSDELANEVAILRAALLSARNYVRESYEELRSSCCLLDSVTLKPRLETLAPEHAVTLAPVEALLAAVDAALGGESSIIGSAEVAAGSLEDRLAAILERIVDEPLATLSDYPDRRPMELRLGHYRPDLSEIAAGLLEEAGR